MQPRECPSCRSTQVIARKNTSKLHYVECLCCGMRGPTNYYEDAAVTLWDTLARKEDSELQCSWCGNTNIRISTAYTNENFIHCICRNRACAHEWDKVSKLS